MEDLGKYLLEVRKQRGIDYSTISSEIHISEEQVKAIEANQLFELGNYGQVKALVYNYARFLEADLERVMAEFRIMMPEHTKKEFIPHRNLKEKKILISTNFLCTVGIVIFVLILGSILLHAYRQGWLHPPDFFAKDEQKTEAKSPAEPERPDSLRLRMRALSESIPQGNATIDLLDSQNPAADNTDYIGEILGESPVNVPIN